MSIIDDALKGVERAQSHSVEGIPESAQPAPPVSVSLSRILTISIGMAAAVAVGWWLVDSTDIDSGVTNEALQEATVDVDLPDSERAEVLPESEADVIDRALIKVDEQVAELTRVTPSSIKVDASDAQTVAALTKRAEEVESDSSGVSRLTLDGNEAVNAADPMLVNATEEQRQLSEQLVELTAGPVTQAAAEVAGADVAELTAAAESAARDLNIDPGDTIDRRIGEPAVSEPAALTDSVAALTANLQAVPISESSPGFTNAQAVEGSVEELTADDSNSSSSKPVVAEESAVTTSGNESVANLTEAESRDALVTESISLADGFGDGNDIAGVALLTEAMVSDPVVQVENPSVMPPLVNTPVDPATATPVVRPGVDTEAAVSSATAAEVMGNYQTALDNLTGADDHDRRVILLKARLLARLRQFDRSSELFASAGEETLDGSASFWLGFARFNLEKWQSAVSALNRASELNSSDAITALYLGLAQQQAGDYLGSIDTFHRARALRPDMPEIAFNTGISWWTLGEKQRAGQAFRHFMRVTDGQRQLYAEQRRRVSQSYLGSSRSN